MITLKSGLEPADDTTVIDPIQFPEVLRIPEKGSTPDRQPPRRQPQPQRQRDNTPATKLYRPDGAIDGAGDEEENKINHIDLIG
jgi:hypothetical protein